MNAPDTGSPAQLLRQLFGDNRAEWPPAQFKELFVKPTYINKVEQMKPCFLVGGRGTGKTTTLQSLRYDSTFDRLTAQGQSFDDQEYVGILVRMNKNRVRAFTGASLEDEDWGRYFAHYFNLLASLELVGLAEWLEKQSGQKLTPVSIRRISIELGLDSSEDLLALRVGIQQAISLLQLQVNNPRHDLNLRASMAEAPIRAFADVLNEEGLLAGKVVFCCIDEYENLLDYQQAILNTYIKHAEPPLSYKVGLRKNGLRTRETRGRDDLLRMPDDYAEVEIEEEGFEVFARAVAELRLQYAKRQGAPVPERLRDFLVELRLADEANLLGASRIATQVRAEIAERDTEVARYFDAMPDSDVYFLRYWQQAESTDLIDLARDWIAHPAAWETRLGNYGFASLFWLSKGAKGVRIRKYYAGERVLLSLAGGNIRYFLELLDTAIGHQLDEGGMPEVLSLAPKAQTLAAREVGQRRLNQLEGLADHGPQLKRLVLAIGKVFFELARSPEGHAPETTSFVLSGGADEQERARELLKEGVAHLAFEAAPRTKPTSTVEVKDDEYRLHRIFCAFFEISHRKKRRMTFAAEDVLAALGDRPGRAISGLLGREEQTPSAALPEQLAFFSPFYNDAPRQVDE